MSQGAYSVDESRAVYKVHHHLETMPPDGMHNSFKKYECNLTFFFFFFFFLHFFHSTIALSPSDSSAGTITI
jgi:hypothetical protein